MDWTPIDKAVARAIAKKQHDYAPLHPEPYIPEASAKAARRALLKALTEAGYRVVPVEFPQLAYDFTYAVSNYCNSEIPASLYPFVRDIRLTYAEIERLAAQEARADG